MLENSGAGNERLAAKTFDRHARVADAELRPPGEHLGDRGLRGVPLDERHLEALRRKIALRFGSVVARELKLVMPLELQPDRLSSRRIGPGGGA